jgi:hypothetical protein
MLFARAGELLQLHIQVLCEGNSVLMPQYEAAYDQKPKAYGGYGTAAPYPWPPSLALTALRLRTLFQSSRDTSRWRKSSSGYRPPLATKCLLCSSVAAGERSPTRHAQTSGAFLRTARTPRSLVNLSTRHCLLPRLEDPLSWPYCLQNSRTSSKNLLNRQTVSSNKADDSPQVVEGTQGGGSHERLDFRVTDRSCNKTWNLPSSSHYS